MAQILDKILINLKKIIPGGVFNFFNPFYHKFLSYAAALFYNWPANKLIIIGVTGTNGKSTTVDLIAKILEEAGFKVGATSTVSFKITDKVWLNDSKMTMLGRFQLQRILRQMLRAGCQYAVIETSSQGIEQSRHSAINYDTAVFTNLTPEHLEAHGGFENYKAAKGKLFNHLTKLPGKKIKSRIIKKTSIINLDDQYADYFLSFPADQKIGYGINSQNDIESKIQAKNINLTPDGSSFEIKGQKFHLKLLGEFNVYNALAAIAVCTSQGVDLAKAARALEKVEGVPGRLEKIDEGQDFIVIVDYAPEPVSLEKAYEVIKSLPHKKIIHILGSCGGGRDMARRPILGRIAAQNADVIIVTNEDPYDDDPQEIIDQVAEGAINQGKILNQNLFKILDRRQAIKKAISLAQTGDLVFITGKGSEQAMVVKDNKKIPWDDRVVMGEELRKVNHC